MTSMKVLIFILAVTRVAYLDPIVRSSMDTNFFTLSDAQKVPNAYSLTYMKDHNRIFAVIRLPLFVLPVNNDTTSGESCTVFTLSSVPLKYIPSDIRHRSQKTEASLLAKTLAILWFERKIL